MRQYSSGFLGLFLSSLMSEQGSFRLLMTISTFDAEAASSRMPREIARALSSISAGLRYRLGILRREQAVVVK